jgi:hypothetical protein
MAITFRPYLPEASVVGAAETVEYDKYRGEEVSPPVSYTAVPGSIYFLETSCHDRSSSYISSGPPDRD